MATYDASQHDALESLLRSLTAYGPASSPHLSVPSLQDSKTTNDFACQPSLDQPKSNVEDHYGIPASYGLPTSVSDAHAIATSVENDQIHNSLDSPASKQLFTSSHLGDATKIIDWPSGLRFVSKLDANDKSIGEHIRKVMRSQREHEEQWWNGRQALLGKQAARVEGKRQIDDVLRAVGGRISAEVTPTDETAELKNYDLKVHRAATKMVDAMATDLKTLGIPFFGTKQSLILDETTKAVISKDCATTESSTSSEKTRKITMAELKILQKRMIQHLEDMYKE